MAPATSCSLIFPAHCIAELGTRIKNTHFKEFSKKGTDHSLESFRTLLDGTTNWPAVMEADKIGYSHFRIFSSLFAPPGSAGLPDSRCSEADAGTLVKSGIGGGGMR